MGGSGSKECSACKERARSQQQSPPSNQVVTVTVGPSHTNAKRVEVPGVVSASETPVNPQERWWADRFQVTVLPNAIEVRRLDQAFGWGQNLQLRCVVDELRGAVRSTAKRLDPPGVVWVDSNPVNHSDASTSVHLTASPSGIEVRRLDQPHLGWGQNLEIRCVTMRTEIVAVWSSAMNIKRVDLSGVWSVNCIPVNPQAGWWRDRFEVAIHPTHIEVRRTDERMGWGQDLHLRCVIQEAEIVNVGPSAENTRRVPVLGVLSAESVPCNPQRPEWTDRFHVTVHPVYIEARRVDPGGLTRGWSQHLQARCVIQRTEVVTVGSSATNVKCVAVRDVGAADNLPINPQQGWWTDQFRVTAHPNQIVEVRRTDRNLGWGQNLQIRCVIHQHEVVDIGSSDSNVKRVAVFGVVSPMRVPTSAHGVPADEVAACDGIVDDKIKN